MSSPPHSLRSPRRTAGPRALARAGALLLLLAGAAGAFEGRYAVRGSGPRGPYEGVALIREAEGALRVSLKTRDPEGAERRARARARRVDEGALAFTCRAVRGAVLPEEPLRATVIPLDAGSRSLLVTYRDGANRVVRRERWARDERVVVPVAVAVVEAGAALPGVTPVQAEAAQAWILVQLEAVFGAVDVTFEAAAPSPFRVAGDEVDRDGDGRLSRAEAERLRDLLEQREVKRPGRVVVAVTAAEMVGPGCRGWTLGDAPPTPHTLTDPNDNFSLVGLRFLDPTRFHTVAHEVAHQFGLDDLGEQNWRHLARPDRRDQLMESGGSGLFLDPEAARLIREAAVQPDHGLDGRRENQVVVPEAD